MDPAVIASCIPGCESLEPDGEDRYRARLTVAMAAITGTYDGTVTLTDIVPLQSYRLTVEGQGRPGFVKGSATIALRAEAVGTDRGRRRRPSQTGGPIARLGQRLIGRRREDDAGSLLRLPAGQDLASAHRGQTRRRAKRRPEYRVRP